MKVRMIVTLQIDEDCWLEVFRETAASDGEPDRAMIGADVRGFVEGYLASMSSVGGSICGLEVERVRAGDALKVARSSLAEGIARTNELLGGGDRGRPSPAEPDPATADRVAEARALRPRASSETER